MDALRISLTQRRRAENLMLISFYDLEALRSHEVSLTWQEGGVREKLSPRVHRVPARPRSPGMARPAPETAGTF